MKKILYSALSVLILTTGMVFYFNASPSDALEKDLVINYGDSLKRVALRLEKINAIKSKKFLIIISALLNRRYIKAGKYKIYPGMTSFEILSKLTRGDVITRKITIPEGNNLYQIAEKLESDEITRSGEFLYYAFDRDFLKSVRIHAPAAEGYLFPDTYVFPVSSDAREIIVLMNRKMKTVLREIDPANRSAGEVHTILILASLIEKEARVPREREYISSVFHNRLKFGMRLDCDPTVRYALKKFTGTITLKDLAHDSPYNTYIIPGLPPTPICSPGKDSIMAASNPKKTDFLYFVAKLNGEHYFSKTLREHNRAVRFFLKGEKIGFIDNQKL